MKNILLLVFSLFAFLVNAQDDSRSLLRGKVLYRDVNVANENVINTTSENATITNENGEYTIPVKLGDELVFTAINYQIKVVKITEEILQNNRLVVEVTEKVTELDEVVVTPEDQKRFLELKNEEFKKVEYEIDRGSKVENIALSQSERGLQDGINFVNIFKAIAKSVKKEKGEESNLVVSKVLRQVYDDRFFVHDLKIPQDKIDAFLFYCDTKIPAKTMLKKENEFQLIDSLVNLSKSFTKDLDEKK